MKQMSFVAACKEFFGFKPGQSLMQFRDELATLTPKDRHDLAGYFKAVGIEIVSGLS